MAQDSDGSKTVAWRDEEPALRESEQRLRWALQSSGGGAWDWDLTTGEAWWSPEMYELWGVAPGTRMFFDNSLALISEQDRDRLREAVEESIAGHTDFQCEFRIDHSTLGERWMTSHGQPFFDDSGHAIRLLGITLDATAQKQAQEALRASEARLELLATVSERLLRSEKPREIVAEICRLLMSHLDCQVFLAYLVDDSDKSLLLDSFDGVTEASVETIRHLDFGEGIAGCVARDGSPLVFEDIQQDADPRAELVKALGIQAYCCHPLKDQDRLFGTLSFGTRSRPVFSLDEVALMKSVADQVAVAMQRLHDKEVLREALAKAEQGDQLLSALMDYVPEGISIADAALNLTRVSRYGQELLGRSHEGKSVNSIISKWNVYHADGKTPMAVDDLPLVRAVRKGELVRDVELVQTNERGESLPILCTAGPIRADDGSTLGGIVVWRSIAERKDYEEELRSLSHFPEENPNPVLRCTPDGELLYANEPATSWLASLGWLVDESLPEPVRLAACEAHGHDHAIETEITNSQDRTISVSSVHPPGEKYINLYGRDVTDRKRARKKQEELITKLEAQNAELERFTYTVSHDLKSPLITIKGFIGILSEDLDEASREAVQDCLDRISRATDTMSGLLEDLLELSRIGRLVNPAEDVPLAELVDEALQLVSGRIQASGGRVDIVSSLPIVRGDRNRLLEVFQNLIENALKYSDSVPRPHIKIGTRTNGDEAICYVCDNGIGIDPQYHDRIFDLFDQLNPNADGTGIGLALVKRIIEVHRGRIWVESEGEGHGSTFCFVIPDAKTPSP